MRGVLRFAVLLVVASCGGSSALGGGPSNDAGAMAEASLDAAPSDATTRDAAADPWACIGRVTYPAPATPMVNVRYFAFDAVSSNAVAGVQVRA